MKIITFNEVRSEITNNIREKKLIPFLGSGFTRGCRTKKGMVPSGSDYKDHMIQSIIKYAAPSPSEQQALHAEKFSSISSIYHQKVPYSVQRNYLLKNFSQVVLEDHKCQFLELPWPYIYTLNSDDGIESNSEYTNVVYSNREISKTIFDERKCVIKLHGHINEQLTYLDSTSEIFDQKQYARSLFSNNRSLLTKLKQDFNGQNLIFIGCSLDDELDILAVTGSTNEHAVSRYYCATTLPNFITEAKLVDFGITHYVLFDNFDDIYTELFNAGNDAVMIPLAQIDQYKSSSCRTLSSDFEINKPYLFYGKSLIGDKRELVLPYFFTSREITQDIIAGFSTSPVQILLGNGASGKTYVATDVARHFRNRSVYFFESKDRLSDDALEQLLSTTKSIIILDNYSVNIHQIERIFKSVNLIEQRDSYWLIVSSKSNRDLSGLIRLLEMKQLLKECDIPKYYISNKFSNTEISNLNNLLVTVNLSVFSPDQTIVDNIITCGKKLASKSKYDSIRPRMREISEISALIALATERKIYTSKVVNLDLSAEMLVQQKATSPLIETESTWSYERSASDNSLIKYVVNAEYWLIDQLLDFSKIKANQEKIIAAYNLLISRIIEYYGKPDLNFGDKDAPYKEYILFDNINKIFKNKGLYLIRRIYQNLNDLLATDPHYLHQRAKCLIKSASVDSSESSKREFLTMAFRDAAVAQSVFEKRFSDSGNEKIQISVAHTVYTKALSLCHLCALDNYSNVKKNTEAVQTLFVVLKSPFIKYEDTKNDTYNYNNAIKNLVTTLVAKKDLVDDNCLRMLQEIFQIIMSSDEFTFACI